jgi:tRNA (guanine37-N1)-methyltransferase
VDDYPYGGGAGMVLKAQPIFDAVLSLTEGHPSIKKPRVILMCPQGERYSQKKAEELSKEEHLIFICGHYEGYDERIREHVVTDEISIGDYVLTGGELASMVIVDSVVRLLPDVLGKAASHEQDSFSTGILEHPHYTRPADFRGMKVPDVLLSGNHAHIEEWRTKESLRRTWSRRPDLFDKYSLTEEQQKWLQEIKKEDKSY